MQLSISGGISAGPSDFMTCCAWQNPAYTGRLLSLMPRGQALCLFRPSDVPGAVRGACGPQLQGAGPAPASQGPSELHPQLHTFSRPLRATVAVRLFVPLGLCQGVTFFKCPEFRDCLPSLGLLDQTPSCFSPGGFPAPSPYTPAKLSGDGEGRTSFSLSGQRVHSALKLGFEPSQ